MNDNIYNNKLAREPAWHQEPDIWQHCLNRRTFNSPRRLAYNEHRDTRQFYADVIAFLMTIAAPKDIWVKAAPLSHNRNPRMAAMIINCLCKPFQSMQGVKQLAWLCSFRGAKPSL